MVENKNGSITSKNTESIMRCLHILLQLWDRLTVLAITAASSLEICCNLFSKSSLCEQNRLFHILDSSPLFFFFFIFASLSVDVTGAVPAVSASSFSDSIAISYKLKTKTTTMNRFSHECFMFLVGGRRDTMSGKR